jgi:hypothetical protein
MVRKAGIVSDNAHPVPNEKGTDEWGYGSHFSVSNVIRLTCHSVGWHLVVLPN